MKSKKLQKKADYVIRLYKGEELLSKIKEFCIQEKIGAAALSAIGAFKNATLGFFDLDKKEYIKFDVSEVEIASCTGNVSLKDGEMTPHIHAVLSDREGKCFGGHIFQAHTGATSEIILEAFSERLERKKDRETGLFLLELE